MARRRAPKTEPAPYVYKPSQWELEREAKKVHATSLGVFGLWGGIYVRDGESAIERATQKNRRGDWIRPEAEPTTYACDPSVVVDSYAPELFSAYELHRKIVKCPKCAVLCDEARALHHGHWCRLCGAEAEPGSTSIDMRLQMLEHGLCFKCNFWRDALASRSARDVIVKGTLYGIGEPQLPEPPRHDRASLYGFGGQKWVIRFHNKEGPGRGREVITHNLWHRGEIPAHFRALPEWQDNALFVPLPPVADWAAEHPSNP